MIVTLFRAFFYIKSKTSKGSEIKEKGFYFIKLRISIFFIDARLNAVVMLSVKFFFLPCYSLDDDFEFLESFFSLLICIIQLRLSDYTFKEIPKVEASTQIADENFCAIRSP